MNMSAADADMEAVQTQQQQTKPKPLRFVTNYGAPHPKRRRIGAACLTCRKRKTACSGERPACETCKQNKQECAGYSAESAAPGHKRTVSDMQNNACQTSDVSDGTHRPKNRSLPEHFKAEQDLDPNLHSGSGNDFPPPPAPMDWARASTNTSRVSPTRTAGGPIQPTSEAGANEQNQESLFSGPRNRMPYFRWLGPTAIMPGFKQMVVKVKRQENDIARSSDGGAAAAGMLSPSLNGLNPPMSDQRLPSIYASTPAAAESDVRTPLNLPFYDNSPIPPSELITHLANTFFTHLGCNYPFLQRERFLRDLEEKQVDAILVDAVCSIAARFSTHPLLTQQTNDENKTTPAEYGHAFAQRAHAALVDTFSCPTVAAVQAALLLAYIEFGEARDSGLWMYLGISIRLAQDLGLHKVEGLKYRGKTGPTPKMIKRESVSGSPELPSKLVGGEKARKDEGTDETARDSILHESAESMVEVQDQMNEQKEIDEQKSVEQERVDTFWAVFYLDRVVSSGVGRRSTLRDKDIDLSFPSLDETDPKSGWPAPFPALIRIVHLYGRVADLLNGIKEPSDITTETPKRLASMESQVTHFYQGLSPRLHFDAVNFQHYVKAGEGTNFVLLHFWFHTLIVLLHQPTLLKTFEGRMLQLFPNSQQLSLSSAKTIADILSYSQLIDAKASLGNPFTSQPIYIAACAFLKESVLQTATSTAQSRASSPTPKKDRRGVDSRPQSMHGTPTQTKRMSISELSHNFNAGNTASTPNGEQNSPVVAEQQKSSDKSSSEQSMPTSAAKTASALAKHTLLATAASQHYQLCYKALQSLQTYWAGTTYILTILDQKFEGVDDPLLYTVEEGESAIERPRPEPSFTSPGWRRKLSGPTGLYNANLDVQRADFWKDKAGQMPGSPGGDLTKAIGWTLTGTMNSPSTNLAWHYPSGAAGNNDARQQQQQSQHQAPSVPNMNSLPSDFDPSMPIPGHLRAASSGSQARPDLTSYPTHSSGLSNQTQNSTDLLLGLNAQYNRNNQASAGNAYSNHNRHSSTSADLGGAFANTSGPNGQAFQAWNYANLWNPNGGSAMQPFGDMMIESHDVDMSVLGLDMLPWFDSYPTHDMTGFYDPSGGHGQADSTSGGHAGAGADSTPRG